MHRTEKTKERKELEKSKDPETFKTRTTITLLEKFEEYIEVFFSEYTLDPNEPEKLQDQKAHGIVLWVGESPCKEVV